MAWLVVVLGVLILGLLLVILRGRKQPLLTAVVDVPAHGSYAVSITPETPASQDLIQLMLSYGIKVRWLLNNEWPELQQVFVVLVDELTQAWPLATDSGPLVRMPTAQQLASQLDDAPRAAGSGERFTVRFYRGGRGDGYVINDLPRPGLAANLPWHFFLLADAVFQRLDTASRERAAAALVLARPCRLTLCC